MIDLAHQVVSWAEAAQALDLSAGPHGPLLPDLALALLARAHVFACAADSGGGDGGGSDAGALGEAALFWDLEEEEEAAAAAACGADDAEEEEEEETVETAAAAAEGGQTEACDGELAAWLRHSEQAAGEAAGGTGGALPAWLSGLRWEDRAAVLLPGHPDAVDAGRGTAFKGSSAATRAPLPQLSPISPLHSVVASAGGRRGTRQEPEQQQQQRQQRQGVQEQEQLQQGRAALQVAPASEAFPAAHRATPAAAAPATTVPAVAAARPDATEARVAPSVAAQASTATAAATANSSSAAACFLARVVHDAAAAHPHAWSDEQVAQLLRAAGKLSYSQPAVLAALQRPAQQAQHGGGGGSGAGAGRDAQQLRVQLQQLLLRLDGLIPVAPRQQAQGQPPSGISGTAPSGAAAGAGAAAAAGDVRTACDAAGDPADPQLHARKVAVAPNTADDGAGADPHGLTAGAAVAAAWAAAALQLRLSPGGAVHRRLLEAFRAQAYGRDKPQQTVVACASGPQPGMLEAATEATRRAAVVGCNGPRGQLAPALLAELLWALARLKLPTSQNWLAEVQGRLASGSGLASLAPAQLVAVAAAAVALREAEPRGVGAGGAGGAVAGPEARAARGTSRAWAAALFAATQPRLRSLTPSQLAELLSAVGRGGRRPDGPWRRALAAALAAAAPRMAPWQLARAATALAKLRVPMTFRVAALLLECLHARLPDASAADVAAVVWALRFIAAPKGGVLAALHRRELRDMAAATQAALPALPPAQLVQLADGFARLGLLPGAAWMAAHREACIRARGRFSEANRRKLRAAYAALWEL